ncbi:General secretion pathway M protein [Salinisphaera sp. PC39]|uniref:type II secretion system protein M n=1 Tax=Salinisphaera sp. PC39 TaxID=1304156 RepID=UPI00334037C6
MNALRQWFDGLARRERVMVLAAVAVAAIGLFYLGVWQPLDRAVADMRERVTHEQSLAAWMTGAAAEASELKGRRRGTPVQGRGESLLSLVDQTSREAGLGKAVRRIQPESDDQAAVTLEGAGFNALVFWLRDLERTYGIRPAALTVNRGEEPGTVSARMTLKRDAA